MATEVSVHGVTKTNHLYNNMEANKPLQKLFDKGENSKMFRNMHLYTKFFTDHFNNIACDVMILHYNTTLTPSSKAIYTGTKYYDTHIEFHSLFLDVSSTDV